MSLVPNNLKKNGNMKFRVSVPPATSPISLDEVKDFAAIDYDAHDTLINDFIDGVVNAAEGWLGRALITQTIIADLDYIPGEVIILPRPPLISLVSISAVDEDSIETDFDTDVYYVTENKDPGRIVFKNIDFPTTDRSIAGYKIVFNAGYGDADAVPAGIRLGLMAWVTDSYENRIISREPTSKAMPFFENFRSARVRI